MKMYQVDAFADRLFEGNPAAVIVRDEWLSDALMQDIAMENNLAETAFVCIDGSGTYGLRWFTPVAEVDLCGHATLAAAHTLFEEYGIQELVLSFYTKSGVLEVTKSNDGLYAMDFPIDHAVDHANLTNDFARVFNCKVLSVCRGKDDFMIETNEEGLLSSSPDLRAIAQMDARGVILTARSQTNDQDFLSRCFYPALGVDEDPVTGSAHTLLGAYWSQALGKSILKARQVSLRGGKLQLEIKGERITIKGRAVTFMESALRL